MKERTCSLVRRLLADEVQGAECYNLFNGDGFSVLDVIAVRREVTVQPIRYRTGPRRAGDPATLVADDRTAADVLSWQSEKTDLYDIIGTAWARMRARYEISSAILLTETST